MSIQLQIGLDVINSYKRLAYTPWHAIAEFVDNSTQAYFDNKILLNEALTSEGDSLFVNISYTREGTGLLRIEDNSIGMSYDELKHALHIANPPKNPTGRSRYGMGMKTAACWIGDLWHIKTKKLGESIEHNITIDVNKVAGGNNDLQYEAVEADSDSSHYTIIEIKDHNRKFHGQTVGKIKRFLSSMYRVDFRNNDLILRWQDEVLTWDEYDDRLLIARDGSKYQKDFMFNIDDAKVWGWVGVLEAGSRADAGFSIIHSGRVIKGFPDAWRPSTLYGQLQGSNDLINQRLIGEINLDAFEVSHTKDDILWLDNQEEMVEDALRKHCGDYREIARIYRKGQNNPKGPSEIEIDAAVDELKKELNSPEMTDHINISAPLPEEAVKQTFKQLTNSIIDSTEETFNATLAGDIKVLGYIDDNLSPNDPYLMIDTTKPKQLIVIVNTTHPYWHTLKGSEGVLHYLRHCVYDGVAEWQASKKISRLDPDTLRLLKDRLLRIPFEIQMHSIDP